MPTSTTRRAALTTAIAFAASIAACASGPAPRDAAIDDADASTAIDSTAPCRMTPSRVDTLMFHRDRARRGWDPFEPALTPATVGGARFGLAWNSPPFDSITIAGTMYSPHLYATPLYVDQVCVVGGDYDGASLSLVFAATSNAFVYAVNAFATTIAGRAIAPGAIIWRTRLGQADVVPVLDGGMPLGVLGTPIIDLDAMPPRLYVVSLAAGVGWQASAHDVRSGALLPGWPVSIDAAAMEAVNRNGPAAFQEARITSQRGALNLSPAGDVLYVPFGAYYDGGVGWLAAIDTRHPRIANSFSGAPSSIAAANAGIWGPGGVSVDVDHDGSVCATTGNSPETSHDAPNVWGQSFLCWDSMLHLTGTFTPFNYCEMDRYDTDLGGSSPVLLPVLDPSATSTPRLVAFGGKQGSVYLLDLDHLPGRADHRPACSTDSTTEQSLMPPGGQPQFTTCATPTTNGTCRGPLNVFGPYSEEFGNRDLAKMRSTPAFFRDANGRSVLFVTGSTKASVDSMISIAPSIARLVVETAPATAAYLRIDAVESTIALRNPGSPTITSNGAMNPIVWVLDENARRVDSLIDPAVPHPVLYAIDATTMTVLWSSARSATDGLFVGGKYSTVTSAHGVVFVGTDRIQAFGVRG